MTAEEYVVPDTADERKALTKDRAAKWAAAGGSPLELRLAPIEEWARRHLDRMGGKEAIMARPLGDSLPDRATEQALLIMNYILRVRSAIARNDATEAAWLALVIGQLAERIGLTLEWESLAMSGKTYSEAQRARAIKRAAESGERASSEMLVRSYVTRALVADPPVPALRWAGEIARENDWTPTHARTLLDELGLKKKRMAGKKRPKKRN